MTFDPRAATDQAALVAALDQLHATLAGEAVAPNDGALPSTALTKIEERFGLSRFERDVLLLCAGMELDSRFGPACARVSGDHARPVPSFALAFAALPGAHWSALSQARPLRQWRMIELQPGGTLAASALRITERLLMALVGVESEGTLMDGLARRLNPVEASAEPARRDEVLAALTHAGGRLLLAGMGAARRRRLAADALAASGRAPWLLRAADLPGNAADRALLRLLWNRETRLEAVGLCVELTDTDTPDTIRHATALLDEVEGAVIVVAPEDTSLPDAVMARHELPMLDGSERRAIWLRELDGASPRLRQPLEDAIDHFAPNRESIALATGMLRAMPDADTETLRHAAWRICREQARRPIAQLARRIEPRAAWDDLVLPAGLMDTLGQIEAHSRHRRQVHETWGFASKAARGLGTTVLFAGASGTGKTMAAEVLSGRLELDLFQIDLSATVSKFIGETEKNLKRIFDAAEEGGAILLFDEADALFGKRTEVRDSHDRYANLEVSYLLQRMEAYRGLAILTTNMRAALDQAFLRRIRFVLDFPFPDAAQRARIWRLAFPTATPTEDLDFDRLARLSVPGGVIRNIATHAAFRAAAERRAVATDHVLWAARLEYAKLDKPMTAAELGAGR
jgi:hypothetical protein